MQEMFNNQKNLVEKAKHELNVVMQIFLKYVFNEGRSARVLGIFASCIFSKKGQFHSQPSTADSFIHNISSFSICKAARIPC